jgi:hypothetical protein
MALNFTGSEDPDPDARRKVLDPEHSSTGPAPSPPPPGWIRSDFTALIHTFRLILFPCRLINKISPLPNTVVNLNLECSFFSFKKV